MRCLLIAERTRLAETPKYMAGKAGAVQPAEEEVVRRSHSNLPVPEGSYREAGGGHFIRSYSERTRIQTERGGI